MRTSFIGLKILTMSMIKRNRVSGSKCSRGRFKRGHELTSLREGAGWAVTTSVRLKSGSPRWTSGLTPWTTTYCLTRTHLHLRSKKTRFHRRKSTDHRNSRLITKMIMTMSNSRIFEMNTAKSRNSPEEEAVG